MNTIIFDMDGLMFDTEKMWLDSFIETGKKIGYDLSKDLHNRIIGTNKNSQKKILIEELGSEFPYDKFHDIHKQLMNEKITKNGVKPKYGLKDLLDYLLNNKYTIAIASSNSKDVIINNLVTNNIDPRIFKVIVSGDMISKGKPNPDIFIKTCSFLKTEPEKVMVLEDSNHGIEAAYKAGCISVLIPDINIITEKTMQMATYKCNNLFEVIDLLEKNK